MAASANRGAMAAAAGQRIKALLSPLETVCRYREQRGDDYARFEVTPRAREALPFSVAVAPGGINIDSPALSIREFPLEDANVTIAIIEAILAGRVRRVVQRKANGSDRMSKTYVFGETGQLLFRFRRASGLTALSRPGGMTRIRYAPYA